jgi:polyhydroxyalkanoate synthesis regulator phasin
VNKDSLKARTIAVRQLIENHQEEFQQLLGDSREQMGLARNKDQKKLQDRVARLEQQLEQARAELST